MADIFISYSKTDQAEARLLAAFMEAEGYSVWWDTSLLSGDKFRKVIMEELAKARAAIVIWTENSVASDWVMSEAGRAHADQKLIPVKARGLEYKDIPPPFDNQHTENLDARENILAAVQGQLAKAPPPPAPLWKKARLQILTWFGIAGAVITFTSNFKDVVTLANWAKMLVANWVMLLTNIWSSILFFLPSLTGTDALLLTSTAFVAANLLMSVRFRMIEFDTRGNRYLLILLCLIILSMFALGFPPIGDLFLDDGLISRYWFRLSLFIYDPVLSRLIYLFGYGDPGPDSFSLMIVTTTSGILGAIIMFLAPVILALSVVLWISGGSIDVQRLNSRLILIIIGVAIILALNYASLWIEQQPWAKTLLSGSEPSLKG